MAFMRQDLDWTLPDNSLIMELYYKDHLLVIKNGNMKFSKLMTETLQNVLSPQSSQLSSSYLSQSSLNRSPLPSSLPRSSLLSGQPFFQSSSFQSLSATEIPVNPKYQIILHNSLTASPKSQTLTASPQFRLDISSSLKTSSDHMSSAKPTKFITSPTSASSSANTPRSFQIQFQQPSNIPHPLLSTITSPCISISILPYIHNSLLIFYSSIYILPSSLISSTMKSTTSNSRFLFTRCITRY